MRHAHMHVAQQLQNVLMHRLIFLQNKEGNITPGIADSENCCGMQSQNEEVVDANEKKHLLTKSISYEKGDALRSTRMTLNHLQNVPSELEAFDNQLRQSLTANVYNSLVEWIESRCRQATEPIWIVVGARCEVLEKLANQASDEETKEQAQGRIRTYFQGVNPGPIAQELQEACQLRPFYEDYNRVMEWLEKSADVGPLARRYHLPQEVVAALGSGCMAPLHPALTALGVHSGQMKAHIELLQSISAGSGVRSGLGMAAAIAGGLLLAPVGLSHVGAIGARLLTSSVTDPTPKINSSLERVGETFDGFRVAFVKAMEAVELNIRYTQASLYGGLLLRIEQDLNAVGRRLIAIDLNSGETHVGLSEKALKEFDSWACSILSQLHELKKKSAWGELGDTADKALRLTVADPLRANVVGENDTTAYVVHFARMRAVAINQAAGLAWKEGRTEDAGRLYRHLIEGTNIAWERGDEGQETPEEESLHLAGLCLAMLASQELDCSSDQAIKNLSLLPAFVIQAATRFDTADSKFCAPGEGVSGLTMSVAAAMTAFATAKGLELDLRRSSIPSPENLNNDLVQKVFKGSQQIDFPTLLAAVNDQTFSKWENSPFYQWLRASAKTERRRHLVLTIKKWSLLLFSVIAFLALAYAIYCYYLKVGDNKISEDHKKTENINNIKEAEKTENLKKSAKKNDFESAIRQSISKNIKIEKIHPVNLNWPLIDTVIVYGKNTDKINCDTYLNDTIHIFGLDKNNENINKLYSSYDCGFNYNFKIDEINKNIGNVVSVYEDAGGNSGLYDLYIFGVINNEFKIIFKAEGIKSSELTGERLLISKGGDLVNTYKWRNNDFVLVSENDVMYSKVLTNDVVVEYWSNSNGINVSSLKLDVKVGTEILLRRKEKGEAVDFMLDGDESLEGKEYGRFIATKPGESDIIIMLWPKNLARRCFKWVA